MRVLFSVARREFFSYFSTTLAAVFLAVFLGAAGALTFFAGDFLQRGQADLSSFFGFHPWLFLLLMPAIGMRLWAEERSTGTIEFLMTLPVATWQAVVGKFLAAWAFAGLALALTFPIWITVNYLGHPDNGVILASYLGSFLMGGAFLALACCFSALTSNQVTAFVVGVAAGFIVLVSSLDPVLHTLGSFAPAFVADLLSSFSFAKHFDAITRGILDLRDVIFFVSFIALMLFFNVQILDRRKSRAAMSTAPVARWTPSAMSSIAVVLAIVLFLGVNFISSSELGAARVDLTEEHLFTVSDSTKTVLAGVGEPLTIKVFETPQLVDSVPVLDVHAKQVSEFLTTLQQLGDNKIKVETIEVQPFSVEEDQALSYGLEGFQMNEAGERGYYGIVGTNSIDGLEVIEFLDPQRGALLQYDMTRLIYRLSHPDEPKVRLIDGLGMFGSMEAGRTPAALLDMIGANFDLDSIPQDATVIPADTDVLVLTHPVRLPAPLQYAIDQYALGGGRVLVFVDPLAERSQPNPQNPSVPMQPSSDLTTLLNAWGVNVDPAKVVGDADMAIQTVGQAGVQQVVADYLPWLRIDGAAFNKDDIITNQLKIMRMSSAGSIVGVEGATTTIKPLIQSSENSMLLDQKLVMQRTDPNVLLKAFVPSGTRQTLAGQITGPAKTAFPDGPPPADPNAETPPAPQGTPLAQGDIDVIVVADTDMLNDSHVVSDSGRPNSNNADFVLNALENLSGGDVLAGARNGGLSYRPFTTIQAIQARAEQTYRATEQNLTQELTDVQAKLAALQQPGQPGEANPLAATREQQATAAEFNARILELRQQLRQVRAELRAEIDGLETQIQIYNILLVPIIVIVLSGLLELWRRARLARHKRRPATA